MEPVSETSMHFIQCAVDRKVHGLYLLITFPPSKGQEQESRVSWNEGRSWEPQVYQPKGWERERERDGGTGVCGGERVRENALVPESAPVPGSRDFGAKGDAAPGVPEAVAWDERLYRRWRQQPLAAWGAS